MNETARTVEDGLVFFIVIKRVTPLKLISLVAPKVTLEDVTKGVADI